MKTEKDSGKPYKKMNTSSRSPSNTADSSRRRSSTKQSSGRPSPQRASKPGGKTIPPRTTALKKESGRSSSQSAGQILFLVLLTLIIIGLGFLIYLFFRPGRVQIWQPGTENGPVIERLEPEEPVVTVKDEVQPEIAPPEKEDQTADTQSSQMREMKVYFVKVNTEGQISLKSTIRSIDFSASPLTRSIDSLIRGPGSDEINKGSLTLIPDGTRLLSARVEEGTAYLNFNEAFRFNPLGREGYLAQLKQVIYTATEFSNIGSVQILIEGVVRDYLGGEGFYIGAPLNRESFQNDL